MSKIWASLLVVISMCLGASAQTTVVSGTITDQSSQAFSNGTWQVTFHPNGFPPNVYNINGASFTQLFTGTMDVNGFMSVTVGDNSLITPTGSQWDFQVCPNTNTPCTTVTLTITGTTQDVSTSISSQVPAIGVKLDPNPNVRPFGRAYVDNEILFPMEGFVYYNVQDECLHEYTRSDGWIKICSGGSGGSTFNCAQAVNGAVLGATSTTAYSCDPNFLTDFFGHVTAQSFATLAPYNGEVQLTAKNTAQPSALPSGTVSWIAPNVVTTSTRFVMPPQGCADNQLLGQQSHDVDPTGTARSFINCLNGTSILLQTNGVNNGSQSKLNLKNGTNITITDDGTGGVTINSTAAAGATLQTEGVNNASQALLNFTHSNNNFLGAVVQNVNPSGGIERPDFTIPQVSTPAQPTASLGGTPGSSTVTWEVIACQDSSGSCNYHTTPSATVTVTTANATLSSSPVTLKVAPVSQIRCYDWYRTVGGPSQGKIATCAGDAIIDNGLAASGSPPSTNTTQLVARLDGYACNVHPDAPKGSVDALPCSPTTFDDEFTDNAFIANANDGLWTWGNQGSASVTLVNGNLVFTTDNNATNTAEYLVNRNALPSTPFSFTVFVDIMALNQVGGCQLGLRESVSGRMATIMLYNSQSLDVDGSGFSLIALTWSSNTANAPIHFIRNFPNSAYLRVQDDGTNIIFFYSPATNGSQYQELGRTTVASAFPSAVPNQLMVGGFSATTPAVCTVDYERRTQ